MAPAELKEQIDELALRLVMGDSESAAVATCMTALEKIQDCAERGKASAVFEAASSLLASLPNADSPTALMSEGIAALQKAVQRAEIPPPPTALGQDPELLSDFIVESREHLVNIESQILTLERHPCDSEALNAAFRGFHTIKGLAGFLELWDVQKLAHEVEAVLDRARNGELTITADAIDVILASADHLRQWLTYLQDNLQGHPSERPDPDGELLERIGRLVNRVKTTQAKARAPPH